MAEGELVLHYRPGFLFCVIPVLKVRQAKVVFLWNGSPSIRLLGDKSISKCYGMLA